MSQEVVGEVTIRSSKPQEVIAAFAGLSPNVATLVGPVRIRLDADSASILIGSPNEDSAKVVLDGANGDIIVRDVRGNPVLRFDSRFAVLDVGGVGNEGDIRVRNNDDDVTIHLDGNSGDITLLGADLAEEFRCDDPVDPGSVVVALGIDEIAPATEPCDRRVVGVVAGAGELRPALRLGTRPGDHRVSVSVLGRVYCKVDSAFGAISPGDQLTTSPTPGHGMRVSDRERSAGAIFGKALGSISTGQALVPILLSAG